MRMDSLRRPSPSVASLSSKRPRLDGMDITLTAAGQLPRLVSASMERFEGFSPKCSGICQLDSATVVWVCISCHLYIWKCDRAASSMGKAGKRAGVLDGNCLRLSLGGVVNADFGLTFVEPFGFREEKDIGVLTVREDGEVICWPCVSGAAPMKDYLKIRDGDAVSASSGILVRSSDDTGDVFYSVVGTAAGDLHLVSISAEDLCLRCVQIFDNRRQTGWAQSLVGRWLGLGDSSSGDEDLDSRVVDILCSKELCNGFILAFVLFDNGELLRFDIDAKDSAQVSCRWRSRRILKNLEIPSSSELTVRKAAWAIFDKAMLLFVQYDNVFFTVELRNVCSFKKEPSIGIRGSTLVLPGASDDEHNTIQPQFGVSLPSSAAIAVWEEGDELVVCTSYQNGGWKKEKVSGVSTGWFALQPFSRMLSGGSSKSQWNILTATCVIAAHSNFSLTENEYTEGKISGGMRPLSRSSRNERQHRRDEKDSRLNEKEAIKVFGRILRAYLQEVAYRRDGLLVAREDNQWHDLQETSPEVLHEAIRFAMLKELDRSPTQRWAENYGQSAIDNLDSLASSTSDGMTFVPQLVKRHLMNKSSRLGSPDGLFGFLEASKLLFKLDDNTLSMLLSSHRRMLGASRLCDLHTEKNDHLSRNLFEKLMTMVVIKQQEKRCIANRIAFDEINFSTQLRSSGLSYADLYYSNLSDLERILCELPGSLDPQSIDDVCLANQIFLAVLIQPFCGVEVANESVKTFCESVSRDNIIFSRLSPEEINFVANSESWTESDQVLEALERQLRFCSAFLHDAKSSLRQNIQNKLFFQACGLVDMNLRGLMRRGLLTQDAAFRKINILLEVESITEEQIDALRILSESFVCHQGLFEVSELLRCNPPSNQASVDILFDDFMNRGPSTRIRLEPAEDGYQHIVNCTGVALSSADSGNPVEWKIKRHGFDDGTIRWSFCSRGGGFLLCCDDNRRWVFRSVAGNTVLTPTIHELFEVVGESDRYCRLVSWDGRTSLGMSFDGMKIFGVYDAEKWLDIAEVVFRNYLRRGNPHRILMLSEQGIHDEALLRFLTTSDPKSKPERLALKEIMWLYKLRVMDHSGAANAMKACYDDSRFLAQLCQCVQSAQD